MVAAGRAGRPGAWLPELEPPTEEELERCPFCGGREDRTPPEALRVGEPWRVRVVPNLYPAFERQEVVIHSPEHLRSFVEIDDEGIAAVAEAWQRRIESALSDGYTYVHTFVNEGRLAGASLPHSHSQLVWLREPPPGAALVADDRLGELLEHGELRVAARGGAVAVVHHAGAAPYECVIAGEAVADLLFLLRDLVARLRALEGARPWNAWLSPAAPTRLHFVPRLTALAGLELGAGLYVNVLPPEVAAERLRAS